MEPDEAIVELQQIDWTSMSLVEAQQAAKDFMAGWRWQDKVPEYSRAVDEKTSVKAIAVFMWNATMKGLEIMQAAAMGQMQYEV